MIAEGFNESRALRTLVHERFTKTEEAIAAMYDTTVSRFENLEG